jgi:hypothetical protein
MIDSNDTKLYINTLSNGSMHRRGQYILGRFLEHYVIWGASVLPTELDRQLSGVFQIQVLSRCPFRETRCQRHSCRTIGVAPRHVALLLPFNQTMQICDGSSFSTARGCRLCVRFRGFRTSITELDSAASALCCFARRM